MAQIEYDGRGSSKQDVLHRIGRSLAALLPHYVGDICDVSTLCAAASDAEMCVGEATDFVAGWSVRTQVGDRAILVSVSHNTGDSIEVLLGENRPPPNAPSERDFLSY